MFLYGTYSLTHSHTGKVLGDLLCLEEGKAMQGDGMVRSPHNHHLVWRERAGLGSPLCTPQSREFKASGGFCLLPSAWGWKCSFSLWSCLGDSPRLCLAGTC